MARSCTCTDECSCIIEAGENIEVSGSGTNSSPYHISAAALRTQLEVGDTPTVDLTLEGTGADGDPYVLTAEATVALQDLTDVNATPPEVGQGPVWDGTQFTYAAPSVPPGQVSAGEGLLGDGSTGNPLRVWTSGTWGSPPLTEGSQDDGLPIYLDSTGALRAQRIEPDPPEPVTWTDIQNRPASDQIRKITISSSAPSGGSNGDVWLQY